MSEPISTIDNSIKNTEIETNNVLAAAEAKAKTETAEIQPAEAKTETPEAAKTEVVPGPTAGAEAAEAKTEVVPEAAKATPGPAVATQSEGKSKHHDGSRDAANKEQNELNKEAAAAAAEKKKKILDKIKKLELDIILKGRELDQAYLEAKNEKTQEGIIVDMKAFSTETNKEIDNLYKQLNDTDEEPLIIKLFSGAWNLIELKFKVIFDKMKLKPKVTEAQLKMIDIISKNIKDIQDNEASLDTEYAQNLENLILSLSKDVSQTPGKSESSSKTPGTPGIMDKIKGAVKKLKTPAAVVADPAAAAAGLVPEAAALVPAAAALDPAAVVPGAILDPAAKLDPAAVVTAAPLALAAPLAEASALAVAAGGGQEGGGISRKRSHPKYINQISENRNKIFKKELEIINSIRHFHRSHTIRKRDRINSILGLRKSRNNKNRNHGNTKRHQHRQNNHKHKSTKHVKK